MSRTALLSPLSSLIIIFSASAQTQCPTAPKCTAPLRRSSWKRWDAYSRNHYRD
jgi:hypothetical protein